MVVKFFGILDFTNCEVYYLGNFKGKIPVGWNMPCYFKLSTTDMPKKLNKTLKRRGILTDDHNFVSFPIYESNSFVIPPFR